MAFKRVPEHVILAMMEDGESDTVLYRLCDEVMIARTATLGTARCEGIAKVARICQQIVTLKVREGRSIPYDMLRYDRCTPATERDASKMERLARAANGTLGRGVLGDDDHTVKVLRFSPNGGAPAIGRWASFGIEVTDFTAGALL